MAWQRVTFRSELDPVVRKELDRDNARMRGWQSKEHNADGSHGRITAESVTIIGDPATLTFINKDETGFSDTVAVTDEDGYLVFHTSIGDIIVGKRPGSTAGAGAQFAGIVFDASDVTGTAGTRISYGFGAATSALSSPPTDAFGLYDVTNDRPLVRVWNNFGGAGAATYMIAPDGAHAASSIYLGDRLQTNTRFTEVAGTMLYGQNGVQERGRTVSMGNWTTYSATYSGLGGQTWGTVTANTLAYMRVGNSMTISFSLDGTVGGTPDVNLEFTIPAGVTITKTMQNVFLAVSGGGFYPSVATALAAATKVRLSLLVAGAPTVWTAGANSAVGQITFEVDP